MNSNFVVLISPGGGITGGQSSSLSGENPTGTIFLVRLMDVISSHEHIEHEKKQVIET